MPVQSRSVVDKAVSFAPEGEGLDFLLDSRTKKAFLIGQVYLFDGPPGMQFDETLVKEIRKTFDPGFVPVHRVMTFKSATGGEIYCHSWGVARYSTKQPGEAEWKLKLLGKASRPSRRTYLGTLEMPNLIDAWYPFIGMDEHGLPPMYIPFDRHAVEVLKQTLSAREEAKDHDAHEAWKKTNAEGEALREKEGNSLLKEGMGDFGERLTNKIVASTSKVLATPRDKQIKES